MNHETVKAHHSIWVVQVYHKHMVYHKDLKSFEDRKDLSAWKSELHSKSAFLENGKLMMTRDDFQTEFTDADILLVKDVNVLESSRKKVEQLSQINAFRFSSPGYYEIFQLKKKEAGIALSLNYDAYNIGEPKRDNFQLCYLELDKPVEIKINGKLDHTLTRGKERTFQEHHYIFHCLGQVDEIELLRSPADGINKKIPQPQKTVDLLKVLY